MFTFTVKRICICQLRCHHSLFRQPTTGFLIIILSRKLSAARSDGISASILKHIALLVCIPLTHTCNLSLPCKVLFLFVWKLHLLSQFTNWWEIIILEQLKPYLDPVKLFKILEKNMFCSVYIFFLNIMYYMTSNFGFSLTTLHICRPTVY